MFTWACAQFLFLFAALTIFVCSDMSPDRLGACVALSFTSGILWWTALVFVRS
jgi:hypothetical protein